MIANRNLEIFDEIVSQTKISSLVIKRHRIMPRLQRRGLTKTVGHGRIIKTEEMISTKDHDLNNSIMSRVKMKRNYSQGESSFIEVPFESIDVENTTVNIPSSMSPEGYAKSLGDYTPHFAIHELQISSNPSSPAPVGKTIRAIQTSDPSLSANDDSYSKYSVSVKMIDPTIILLELY